MIADAALRIAGDHATVTALMGPGIDPHLYKASESDVRRLSEADLILYQGLYLEGRMADILNKMSRTRPVLAVGETIPEEELLPWTLGGKEHDPHLWFDVRLWSRILAPIAAELSALRPEEAATFEANALAYQQELTELDAWAESRFNELPRERRILVTAHDAFGYMGRRYDLEVVGIQGVSTVAEAGLDDLERVIELVVEKKVPAVFVESSVSPRSIEALQKGAEKLGHSVAIGAQLFSDALGPADGPAGNYPGMVRTNVSNIVGALGNDGAEGGS